ncbi:hypothetical protein HYU11_03460 [Candidatus Woesearchaeota archaeon]|nr:hypothetical protein [Candidatus Woesearchaeota archaeon]
MAGKKNRASRNNRMGRGNRSQAAMEFLMTYGWAILVVLVVIGALAYFGVLSPDNFLPEKCTISAGLKCKDFSVMDRTGANDYIIVSFVNAAGRGMIIRDFNASADIIQNTVGCWNVTASGVGSWATQITVPNGETASLILDRRQYTGCLIQFGCIDNCVFTDSWKPKQRFKLTIIYSWQDSPAIRHQLDGELLARIEKG